MGIIKLIETGFWLGIGLWGATLFVAIILGLIKLILLALGIDD